MKAHKVAGFLVLLTFCLLCTGCPTPSSDDSLEIGMERTFWAYDYINDSYYETTSTLRAIGTHSLIYVENSSGATTAHARYFSSEFDDKIYDMVRENFAQEPDMDQNGKVIILLLDILDGATADSGFIAGYFSPQNQFLKDVFNPNSNQADMIFIDTYPSLGYAGYAEMTLAHEFQHLVNFWQNFWVEAPNPYNNSYGLQQDTWIDEGLAEAAAQLYLNDYDSDRLYTLNEVVDSENSGSIEALKSGDNFISWQNDDTLVDYATTNFFFQWLRIHANNGNGIFKEIIDNDSSSYPAVVEVFNLRVNQNEEMTFHEMLQSWYLAILLNKETDNAASEGLYNFKGEFSLTAHNTDSNGTIALSPGEAVFDSISSPFTPDGTTDGLLYLGVDSSSGVVDREEPYSGNRILVMNSNLSGSSVINAPVSSSITPMADLPDELNASSTSMRGPRILSPRIKMTTGEVILERTR